MNAPLVFVIAAAAALPESECDRAALEQAQRRGPGSAFALRLFTAAGLAADALAELPLDPAPEPAAPGRRLICDAVVPRFEPRSQWLGVYRADGEDDRYRCLDRFPLAEAANETCWFYPTHDGRFLSWERALAINLAPGAVASDGPLPELQHYAREQVTVLWSLLADDASLTCVGLTYAGQRIEWPMLSRQEEPMATWSLFSVNTQAEVPLVVDATRTLFQEAPSAGEAGGDPR